MANRWHNIKRNVKQHKYRIFSLLEGVALFLILLFLMKFSNTSLCLVYNIFGVKCFGCGMTRAFVSILRFDFISAEKYNLLSVPIFIGIVIYCIFLLTDIIFDSRLIKTMENFLSKKYMYVVYVFVVILNGIMNNCIMK